MTTLMRFDPFRDLDRLSEQVIARARVPRTLPMTACRRGDELLVWLDLPGVDPTDVDVTVERNVVNIRAERRTPLRDGDEILIDERTYGDYTRQLFLGDNMDASRVVARLDDGVLNLTIPVAEKSKPRQVRIDAAQPQQASAGSGSGSGSDPGSGSEPSSRG